MEWRSVCLRDIAHQLMVTGCGRVHLDPTAYSRMPQSDTFPSTRGFSRHTCPHPHMDMLVPARRGSGERSRRGAMPEYRREEERIRCMCTGYSCLQCLDASRAGPEAERCHSIKSNARGQRTPPSSDARWALTGPRQRGACVAVQRPSARPAAKRDSRPPETPGTRRRNVYS
jgi:hypothetical protein